MVPCTRRYVALLLIMSFFVDSMIIHDTSPLPLIPGRPPEFVNADTVTAITSDLEGV
jgi:hypothetical protein